MVRSHPGANGGPLMRFSETTIQAWKSEFASLAVGGDRSKWYADAFRGFEEKYPMVKGLIFFHHGNDASTTYQSLNWQVTSERPVLDSIRSNLFGKK
jgi:hypothetical protein